jgi:hypothetical protein
MSSRVCPVCDAWLQVWRLSDDEIGTRILRLPIHKRGKLKTAPWCPAGGTFVPTVAAPRQS